MAGAAHRAAAQVPADADGHAEDPAGLPVPLRRLRTRQPANAGVASGVNDSFATRRALVACLHRTTATRRTCRRAPPNARRLFRRISPCARTHRTGLPVAPHDCGKPTVPRSNVDRSSGQLVTMPPRIAFRRFEISVIIRPFIGRPYKPEVAFAFWGTNFRHCILRNFVHNSKATQQRKQP